jgi:hypothetical protein
VLIGESLGNIQVMEQDIAALEQNGRDTSVLKQRLATLRRENERLVAQYDTSPRSIWCRPRSTHPPPARARSREGKIESLVLRLCATAVGLGAAHRAARRGAAARRRDRPAAAGAAAAAAGAGQPEPQLATQSQRLSQARVEEAAQQSELERLRAREAALGRSRSAAAAVPPSRRSRRSSATTFGCKKTSTPSSPPFSSASIASTTSPAGCP